MQHQPSIKTTLRSKYNDQTSSLQNRADEVLTAIAVLGLVATIVDGNADFREIDTFTQEFRKQFALSRRQSQKIIGLALSKIRTASGIDMIDCACDTLNEHLDPSQKVELFEALSEILIVDGRIHEGEEYFLDYIADKLDMLKTLEKRYPIA